MRYLVIFLIMFVACFAANETHYVSTVGDNSNGQSPATAWNSLVTAIDSQTCSGGDTCTIKVLAGDTLASLGNVLYFDDVGANHTDVYFVIESTISGTQWTQLFNADYAFRSVAVPANTTYPGSVILRDCIFGIDSSGPLELIYYNVNSGMHFTLERCTTITRTSGATYIFAADNAIGTAKRNIVCTDCTLNTHYGILVTNAEVGDVTLTNCQILIDTENTGYVFDIKAGSTVGDLLIDGCSMSTTVDCNIGLRNVADAPIKSVTILDSLFNCESVSIHLPDDVYDIYIEGSTFTSENDHAIKLGTYDVDGTTSRLNVDAMNVVSLIDNNIYSGTGGISSTCYGTKIIGNMVNGNSHAIAIYGNNSTIVNNVVKAGLGLTEFSDYNYIANNTIYCTGNAYISGGPSGSGTDYDGWQYSRGSIVINNIFMTTTGASYAFWDYDGNLGADNHDRGDLTAGDSVTYPYDDFPMSHFMDYNCYYCEGGNCFKIGPVGAPTVANTPATIQTAWQTANNGATWNKLYGAINDLNSIVTDPGFVNTGGTNYADYALSASSQCRDKGHGQDIVSMGAIMPRTSVGRRTRYDSK